MQFLFIYLFIFETEGWQANVKAHDTVDHLEIFFVK